MEQLLLGACAAVRPAAAVPAVPDHNCHRPMLLQLIVLVMAKMG